jgi:hypothetical protein
MDWPGDKSDLAASLDQKMRAIGQGTSMPDELSVSDRCVDAAGRIVLAADSSAAAR